jgi:hypothetical protein
VFVTKLIIVTRVAVVSAGEFVLAISVLLVGIERLNVVVLR